MVANVTVTETCNQTPSQDKSLPSFLPYGTWLFLPCCWCDDVMLLFRRLFVLHAKVLLLFAHTHTHTHIHSYSPRGVIILGVFIGIVGHALSEAQANAINKLKRRREHRLLQVLTRSNSRRTEITRNQGFFHDHITLMADIREVCRAELPEILVVMLLAWILGIREGWSFTSTMYFAIMSASTVSFISCGRASLL